MMSRALEAALADCDVACVLAEPIMTNVGMVLARLTVITPHSVTSRGAPAHS
jgi:glutamate-1-semialdehyde aminotransferase